MLQILLEALRRFCSDCLAQGYQLLLEAEVTGWLFHILLEDPEIQPQHVHLGARVCGVDRSFFDLALGPVHAEPSGRPCVRPVLVVEVKLFPTTGFTPPQHYVHYRHVIDDDLPKLGKLTGRKVVKAQVLVDGAGYLNGLYHGENRLAHVVAIRDQVVRDAHIFVVKRVGLEWNVEHIPPHD